MAEKIVSPGVLKRERDLTVRAPDPAPVSTAIVGPTTKGPVLVPNVVSSMSEYESVYGDRFISGSDYYTHLTHIAAEKYFRQGGTSLLVSRVVPGTASSYKSAEAELLDSSSAAPSVTIETLSEGVIMNNTGSVGNLESLDSGSKDNIRWEVTNRSESRGTFDIVVRRGNDNENDKVILESWTDLSLDPESDNYVSKVIGDMKYQFDTDQVVEVGQYPNNSRYIRVANVNKKTPEYLTNENSPKTEFTGSIPAVGSGSYHGSFSQGTGTIFKTGSKANYFSDINSTNTQGLSASSGEVSAYNNAITLLQNTEEYRFNVISTPGLNYDDHSSTVSGFLQLAQNRGDAIYVVDPIGYSNATVSTAKGAVAGINSSYGAAYWPWLKIDATTIGKEVWVPASTIIPSAYEFSDQVSAEWFAPAGFTRGGLPGVLRAQRKLSVSDRNELYQSNINPIATFPGEGVVVYGQKTLESRETATNRVNVRRLLIELKTFLGDQANRLVFEQNTNQTRNRFLSIANPYLSKIAERQGLYDYRVIMDETNNTNSVIDRNQLVGKIAIQPTRTAEFIILDFVLEPTGASFS